MTRILVVLAWVLAGCIAQTPYQRTTTEWTRKERLTQGYQEVLQLAAIYKSPAWHRAYAEKDIATRHLGGASRDARLAQADADAAGDHEFELLVTTWDRRENDLDRGKRAVWRVTLLDDAGNEIPADEIKKDKRPVYVLRSEFPAMGDFATAYVAKFKRDPARPLGRLRLRLSSERGGVEVEWPAAP